MPLWGHLHNKRGEKAPHEPNCGPLKGACWAVKGPDAMHLPEKKSYICIKNVLILNGLDALHLTEIFIPKIDS